MLTEKNNLLPQELEKSRTQLASATAELEKSKKAFPGNVSLHREKQNYVPAMLTQLHILWEDRQIIRERRRMRTSG